ncbi:MAG: SoxR reducing system RseC family protein [Oscillospiraceae bacterium]|nr:SoxR reducing system RseC family protein [Oscillospiraceae bacterium]
MKKKAYVKEASGDVAVLLIKRECACGRAGSCEASCFSLQSETIEAKTDNQIGAKAGDFVEVEGKTSAILAYSALVFLLPVFAGLSLYFVAASLVESLVLPYVVSAAGFLASVAFLYYFLNNIAKKRNDFKITRII